MSAQKNTKAFIKSKDYKMHIASFQTYAMVVWENTSGWEHSRVAHSIVCLSHLGRGFLL